MCLFDSSRHPDDVFMESTEHIYLKTCSECELPALTFDERGHALCGHHATVFIAAVSVKREDDEGS